MHRTLPRFRGCSSRPNRTEGQGAFGSIGWVQRVQTVGGKAPSSGCDQAHAGTETRVDYRATYYFYAR